MSHNPYTPPAAPVDDLALAPLADPDGGRDVLRACRLMWISFWLSTLIQLIGIFTSIRMNTAVIVGVIIGLAIGLGIGYLMTWWITSRLKLARNWMRILLAVLAVLGILVPVFFWDFYKNLVFPLYAGNLLLAAIGIIQFIMWLVSLGLLFTPRSNSWFVAMQRARA